MSLIEDIFDFREIESNRIELSPSTFLIRKCMEDVIDVSYLRYVPYVRDHVIANDAIGHTGNNCTSNSASKRKYRV